jgi:hypothetical protein
MSIATQWVIATDADAEAVLADEAQLPGLWLDGIRELELMALGDLLGTEYAPSPVLEVADGTVLRIDDGFLRRLAAVGDGELATITTAWVKASEPLRAIEGAYLEATLRDMAGFAREALAGDGILATPMT